MIRVALGTTRAVLLAGPWAVKVPRLAGAGHGALWGIAHGLLANLSERALTDAGATGIAPVLHSWLGGLVQVYPRCRPALFEPMRYDAISADSPVWVPVDGRPNNIGDLDGQLVWLDYAASGECVACGRYEHQRRNL